MTSPLQRANISPIKRTFIPTTYIIAKTTIYICAFVHLYY